MRKGRRFVPVVLLVVVCLGLFGCAGKGVKSQANIVVDTQYYDTLMNCFEFVMIAGEENEAIRTINEEIDVYRKNFEKLLEEGPDSSVSDSLEAYPVTTERYLNLVFYGYLGYGSDGDILTWVYDKGKKCRLTASDALAMAQTDLEELAALVEKAVSEKNEDVPRTVEKVELSGFYIRPDGEVVLYLYCWLEELDLTEKGQGYRDAWRCNFTYTSTDKSLVRFTGYEYDEEGIYQRVPLIAAQEVDETEKPLWCRWKFSETGEPAGGLVTPERRLLKEQ